MSKRKDVELLSDIREAIRRIEVYIEKLNYRTFLQDIKTQDAVVRNLEIIGEAAKGVSTDIKKKYTRIPWKELAGVRDRLIHHYFGVNYDIVWAVVSKELPQLTAKIEGIKKDVSNRS